MQQNVASDKDLHWLFRNTLVGIQSIEPHNQKKRNGITQTESSQTRWITFANSLDQDQARHSVQAWSGSKLFDTLEVMTQVEVEPMYFNFAFNLYMALSSAVNPFKQFGPRSGLTFCSDLIGVQTVWHFKGYEKLRLNRCILIFVKPLHDIVICC